MSTSWKLVNNSLVLREGLEYCRDTLIKEKKKKPASYAESLTGVTEYF